jgi:hypothetical protein
LSAATFGDDGREGLRIDFDGFMVTFVATD